MKNTTFLIATMFCVPLIVSAIAIIILTLLQMFDDIWKISILFTTVSYEIILTICAIIHGKEEDKDTEQQLLKF